VPDQRTRPLKTNVKGVECIAVTKRLAASCVCVELIGVEIEAAKREAAIYRSQSERITADADRLRAELDSVRVELVGLRGAHEALKGRDIPR
jgi:hypothetical protein